MMPSGSDFDRGRRDDHRARLRSASPSRAVDYGATHLDQFLHRDPAARFSSTARRSRCCSRRSSLTPSSSGGSRSALPGAAGVDDKVVQAGEDVGVCAGEVATDREPRQRLPGRRGRRVAATTAWPSPLGSVSDVARRMLSGWRRSIKAQVALLPRQATVAAGQCDTHHRLDEDRMMTASSPARTGRCDACLLADLVRALPGPAAPSP